MFFMKLTQKRGFVFVNKHKTEFLPLNKKGRLAAEQTADIYYALIGLFACFIILA